MSSQSLPSGTCLRKGNCGNYEIVDVIEEGDFSITYSAIQYNIYYCRIPSRKVVIKEFFLKDLSIRSSGLHVKIKDKEVRNSYSQLLQTFIEEARQNIDQHNKSKSQSILVLDVFEENGTAYYVTETSKDGALVEYEDHKDEKGHVGISSGTSGLLKESPLSSLLESKSASIKFNLKQLFLILCFAGFVLFAYKTVSSKYDDRTETKESPERSEEAKIYACSPEVESEFGDVTFEAKVETPIGYDNVVPIEMPFKLVYTLHNASFNERTPEFHLGALSEFEVIGKPDRSTSSGISVSDGVTTKTKSVSYTFSITPKKEGLFTIPAAKAFVGNQAVYSNAVDIEVVDGEKLAEKTDGLPVSNAVKEIFKQNNDNAEIVGDKLFEAKAELLHPNIAAIGERIYFSFIFYNISVDEEYISFPWKSLPEFKVLTTRPSKSSSSTTTPDNVVKSQTKYTFLVEPKKEGIFTIPAAKAVVGNKTIVSNSVTLKVVDGSKINLDNYSFMTGKVGDDDGKFNGEVSFVAETDDVVTLGKPFNVIYTLSNAESDDVSLPLTSVPNFRKLKGPIRSMQTNVQKTTTYSVIFESVFVSDKEGEFTIPEATAKVEGETIKSNPLKIKVVK